LTKNEENANTSLQIKAWRCLSRLRQGDSRWRHELLVRSSRCCALS